MDGTFNARIARIHNLFHVLDPGPDRRRRPALDPRGLALLFVASQLTLRLLHEGTRLLAILVGEVNHRANDAPNPRLGRLFAELGLDATQVRFEQIGLDRAVARQGEALRLSCKQPLLEPVRVREDAQDAVRNDSVMLKRQASNTSATVADGDQRQSIGCSP